MTAGDFVMSVRNASSRACHGYGRKIETSSYALHSNYRYGENTNAQRNDLYWEKNYRQLHVNRVHLR